MTYPFTFPLSYHLGMIICKMLGLNELANVSYGCQSHSLTNIVRIPANYFCLSLFWNCQFLSRSGSTGWSGSSIAKNRSVEETAEKLSWEKERKRRSGPNRMVAYALIVQGDQNEVKVWSTQSSQHELYFFSGALHASCFTVLQSVTRHLWYIKNKLTIR